MMLLIGLAITVAFLASWGATLGSSITSSSSGGSSHSSSSSCSSATGSRCGRSRRPRRHSTRSPALLPDEAERVEGDTVVTVSPADLVVGDVVVVRPGGSIPADGRIIDGTAAMDESMVTGESRPVTRATGDTVTAGTVATDSGLRVEITATGDDTALAGIQRLVTEAQNSSSRAQRIADRAAALLFWFALLSAALTAVVWPLVGTRMPPWCAASPSRHRLPARTGPRDPAGRVDRDRARGPRRRPHQGPPRAGEHAHGRCPCSSTRPARSPREHPR